MRADAEGFERRGDLVLEGLAVFGRKLDGVRVAQVIFFEVDAKDVIFEAVFGVFQAYAVEAVEVFFGAGSHEAGFGGQRPMAVGEDVRVEADALVVLLDKKGLVHVEDDSVGGFIFCGVHVRFCAKVNDNGVYGANPTKGNALSEWK